MTTEMLDDVIATRELSLVGENRPVIVSIGRPRLYEGGPSWCCPYRILGIGDGRVRYGAGVDAVQALWLTLRIIAAHLHASEEAKAGRLQWDGGDHGDYGFPVPGE